MIWVNNQLITGKNLFCGSVRRAAPWSTFSWSRSNQNSLRSGQTKRKTWSWSRTTSNCRTNSRSRTTQIQTVSWRQNQSSSSSDCPHSQMFSISEPWVWGSVCRGEERAGGAEEEEGWRKEETGGRRGADAGDEGLPDWRLGSAPPTDAETPGGSDAGRRVPPPGSRGLFVCLFVDLLRMFCVKLLMFEV